MKCTEEQKALCKNAEIKAKEILKKGDRIGCTKCPGTKRVFTFEQWDGCWMVSKSGICDYHPVSIYSINGKKISFK
jgi:hypothetical protein